MVQLRTGHGVLESCFDIVGVSEKNNCRFNLSQTVNDLVRDWGFWDSGGGYLR